MPVPACPCSPRQPVETSFSPAKARAVVLEAPDFWMGSCSCQVVLQPPEALETMAYASWDSPGGGGRWRHCWP